VINNAGVLQGRTTIENVTPALMMSHYVTNCMGPLFVVQQLLKADLLPRGALIANLTSLVRPSPP